MILPLITYRSLKFALMSMGITNSSLVRDRCIKLLRFQSRIVVFQRGVGGLGLQPEST